MLSLATCGLVATPENQDRSSSARVQRSATVQQPPSCVRDMPNLSQYGFENVRAVLAKHNLSLGEVTAQPNDAPKGAILGQSWKPGTPVRCGTAISITVSSGPRSRGDIRVTPDRVEPVRCSVPDLTNQQLDDVQAPLRKRKWSIGRIHPQESPARPGTILEQSPQPGVYDKCDWSIDVAVAVPITVQPPPPPPIDYCYVPDMLDADAGAAQQKFAAAGLKVGSVGVEGSDRPRGTVLWQSLKAGRVPCGSTVNLRVSSGPKTCTVPNLAAGDLAAASRMLGERNLQLGNVGRETSERKAGTVLGQKPGPDAIVACGSTVDVVIAIPLPPVYVPILRGQDEQTARRTLERTNLTLGTIERRFADVAAGLVVEQQPAADTPVRRGSAVSVQISDGPAPRFIPDLQRLDRRTAADLLAKEGFRLGDVFDRQVAATPGTIVEQRPRAGTPAPADTVVQAWVAVPLPSPPAPPPTQPPTPTPTPVPEATAPQSSVVPPAAPPSAAPPAASPSVAPPSVAPPSTAPANVVPEQRGTPIVPAAPAAPEVAAQPALERTSEPGTPWWWLLLGMIGGAAVGGVIANVRGRTPRALPPSVTLEPRPDADIVVKLSADGALFRSELWLSPCPDTGVQTADPFGISEVTESR